MTLTDESGPGLDGRPVDGTPSRGVEAESRSSLIRRPLVPVVWGVALILAGLAWVLDSLGVIEFRPSLVLPGLLLIVGLALVVGSFWDAHPGLVTLGSFLLILTLLTAAAPFGSLRGGLGQRSLRVTSAADLDPLYRLGLGELRLDLSDLVLERDTSLAVEVGAGAVIVTLPADVSWDIDASVGAGQVSVLGRTWDGIDVDRSVTGGEPGAPEIALTIDIGAGNIEVRR